MKLSDLEPTKEKVIDYTVPVIIKPTDGSVTFKEKQGDVHIFTLIDLRTGKPTRKYFAHDGHIGAVED